MKLPEPVPSVVTEPDMVGFAVVAQQTPRAVTAPPPLAVIFPPETAVVKVIEVTAVVVRVAVVTAVANVSSFPYAVPPLLIA
jgi:hypothetical protein